MVLAFLVQCFLTSRIKTPAWDETGDISAGLSYIATDKFTVNLQHPPLLKDLIGLFTWASGARWPGTPAAQALLAGDTRQQWNVGGQILMQHGADSVLFWARLPMILTGGMLVVLLYLWGRRIVGQVAAVGAGFLCALDPTIVAHASLATFDVGFAAFTMLFLFALWSYLQYPSWKRLVWCGLALGAMLSTKFSAPVLLPVAAVLVAAALWKRPAAAGKAPRGFFNLYDASPETFEKTGANDPCPCGSGKKFKKCHGEPAKSGAAPASTAARRITAGAVILSLVALVAVFFVEATYFFPANPFLYLKGMGMVNADHMAGYAYYMAGHFSSRFLSYFAVAWLVKEPLPTIVLAILGLVLVLRSRTLEMLDKLFLLLPPVVLFLAHTFLADDVGFRYVIPVLPFGYLLGGVALAELIRSGAVWKRALAGALCAWLIVAAIGIHPDNLSYFNEAACLLDRPGKIGLDGGSRCGTAWLDDSSVDWGSGVKQLRDWWNRNGGGRRMKLAYFGSFPPQYYGLHFDVIDPKELPAANPAPGVYVISAHAVARVERSENAPGAWMRRIEPTAMVGHCLYVYDIK
jgi:hypothetical protein